MTLGVTAPVHAQTVSVPALAPTPETSKPVAQPGTVDSARQLIDLMHLDRTIDFMFKPLIPIMTQAVLARLEQSEAKPLISRLINQGTGGRARLEQIFTDEMAAAFRKRYPEFKEAAAKEYAAAFTEPELRDLVAFYSSGTGAKALALQPVLQQRLGLAGGAVGERAGEEGGRRAVERAVREMLGEDPQKSKT